MKNPVELLKSLLEHDLNHGAPNSVFLRWSNNGGDLHDLKFNETRELINRLGTQFSAWNLDPGARMLIASQDDHAVATVFLACLHYGITAMVVDPRGKPAEIASVIAIQKPDAAIIDQALSGSWPLPESLNLLIVEPPRQASLVSRLLRRSASDTTGSRAFPRALAGITPAAPPQQLDPALDAYILFTSGSTAQAKGVRVSRLALGTHLRTLIQRWGYDSNSRILDILPLHHTDGLIQGILCAWASGGRCVRTGPFQLDSIIQRLIDPIYREQITHLVAVPTMLSFLLRYADSEERAFQEPSFKFIISAAGYLDAELWRSFEERFGVRICNIYGLTETVTGGCFAGPDNESHVIGSVGIAVDCAVRIIGDDGGELPLGQPGELCMHGAHVLSGYLNDESATNSALTNGWLRTGDIATVEQTGIVRIIGRKKNLVISGGLNIQPEEVAEFLRGQPGIGDAVAFGISDPDFTEILVACVTATHNDLLDTEVLLRACRGHLSDYKIPKAIIQLSALPYGPSGKVVVPQARELFLHARSIGRSSIHGDVRSRVYDIAATIFHIPVQQLSEEDAPGRTPGWDSFAHLTFITGLESSFAVRMSTADIMSIRRLGDAVATLNRLSHA